MENFELKEIQIIEWGCFHKSREILHGRRHVKHADHVRKMLNDIEARYTSFPGNDERA